MESSKKQVEVTEYKFDTDKKGLAEVAKYISAIQDGKNYDLKFLHDLNTTKKTYMKEVENKDKKVEDKNVKGGDDHADFWSTK